MPRIFAYRRVSATGQTTQNQSMEIKVAGANIAGIALEFKTTRQTIMRVRKAAS